jgi:PAS domain S-box-containing protein
VSREPTNSEFTVLVLAPTGRNAEASTALLSRAGIAARPCASIAQLCAGLQEPVGAVLIEEEAIASPRAREELSACLGEQPPWSDLPFIVLTRNTLPARRELPARRLPEALGNVMFLERPLHAFTFTNAVHTALRARRRQYQVRDHLAEREETAAKLRELNQTLESRVEERTVERDRLWSLSEDLLVLTDYAGNLFRVSPSWTRLLGYDEATLLRTRYPVLVHPDDFGAANDLLRDMRRSHLPVRFEHRVRAADGSWRWIAWTLSPEPGSHNIHGVGRDVTEQKERAEALAKAEEQLRQAQKMEAIGQLTGGVAHDFNNLLTGVLGNLELLEPRLRDERSTKLVQAASRSAWRGAQLTQQLLAFARRQVLTAKPTDLNAAVNGMSDMLRRTIGEHGVGLRTVLAPSLWPSLVDATQIEVAILNLAINARDAMPVGGRVVIATRNIPAGARDLPPELRAGDYVMISVTDSGEGMTPETLAKAFDPFFTTKGVGKGTGLGLSQVYGLARQSGGTARIRSTLGQGTTAEIYLPRAAALSTETSAEAETAWPTPQRRTVLVADDQDDVREVIVAHLEALGYRCVAASNGQLALDLLGGGGNIDILLVDYAMPGLSGMDVIQAARKTNPGLAVVLTTGYAQGEVLRDRLERVLLLKKPFRTQELAAAIAQAWQVRHQSPAEVLPLVQPRT